VKRPRIKTENDGPLEQGMKLSAPPDKSTDGPGSAGTAGADKQAFVSRLQTILAHWPSADRLARAMGVSPSAFRKWLKGEAEPSRERLVALARVAGVSIAWLAQGEGPEPTLETVSGVRHRLPTQKPSTAVDPAQFVLLPKQSDSSGDSTPAAPPMSGFLALRHDWVRTAFGVEPDNLQLEIAAGDAMGPTIRHGDTILIDTADRTLRNAGIYVLQVNDQRLVKRVQRRHDGSLVLISDNSVYQPDIIDPAAAAGVVVVGRVVWVGGAV
jgi:phage repressor protein C with HTH and peptisase S24 domain